MMVMMALALFARPVEAQTYNYHVYIDSDLRTSTGCTISAAGQSFVGADYRLTATVSGTPPQVTARNLAPCTGGTFAAGSALSANYPVGLNNGLPLPGGAFADVIELSVTRSMLTGAQAQMRFGIGAVSASGSVDVLYTQNGLVGGPALIVGSPALIPTLGFFGALLMALALVVVALRTLKRNRGVAQMLLVAAFLSVGLAAWAANFVADGLVGDWASTPPKGMDALGDALPDLAGSDLVGTFAAEENLSFFFRVDVVDVENQPPVAVNDSYTTLEDTPLNVAAPGVLANDSDADGNPISAQLVSGPTQGTLTLNANGGFSYTPNANANGTDTFTYNAFDGQVPSANPALVTITITPVNDVPVFTAGANQTVNEDAGPQTVNPWALGINDGDPEVTQTLSFTVLSNSNPALFSAAPAISATGVMTYTPAADASGSATLSVQLSDDGGTANGGVDTSAAQTFTITVNTVNDAPTLTASNPPTVLEDAAPVSIPNWASFNPGPPDEAAQTLLAYQISAISNPALFAAGPALANDGTLTYTVAANANGSSTFVARAQDSGGTANGGIDLSAVQTFTINVTAVNDAPSFTVGADQTVNEDAGPQTVNAWLSTFSDGDPEVIQALSFVITNNSNPALFSSAPSVSPVGTLTYTPAANANGSAIITLRIEDDGSNTPPNVNTSATQTFTINVTAVNDAPSFVAGANQTVNEDAAAQTINPWATAISPGPADEAAQTVSFSISNNSDPGLFSALPAVSPTGVLTYTPAADANGSATLTLILTDSGSNTPPNVNVSAPQTFTITISAVNDAPINTVPPIQTTPDTVPLVFDTANTNAISVADIDAAAGIVQMSFGTGAPANGTLTLANPGGVLTSLTGNGSALVTATGTITALNLALNGPSGSLTYTPVVGTTATRTITVISNDQGNTGSGGPLSDTDTIDVNADAAPIVSSTPANGATIANNAAITVNFSESVDVSAGITLNCGGNIALGGSTGSAVTSLNLTYAAPLPAGPCTLTVPQLSVTDVDVIDPPQNPVATYAATFTVDAAPALQSSTPGALAVVNTAQTVTFTYNEPVNDLGSAITLNCAGPIAGAISGSGTATLTFTPSNPLPAGASCLATAVAAQIDDVDGFDPPANPIGDSTINFSVDAAPAFVSSIPAANGAVVGTGQIVSFTFDENVANLGGAITLNCGSNVAGSITGDGTTTLTFTPSAALTAGASCTATAVALQIGDSDLIDPPQNPITDVVRTFIVDVAPTVTTSNPVEGAINVPLAGVVSFTFSENVDFAAVNFTYVCNGNPVVFNVAGSGTNTATLTPTANLPINSPCTVTALTTIVDTDTADPPNDLSAAFPVNFTSVNDSAPTVQSITPANNAVSASGPSITVIFSETVDIGANAITVLCAPSGATLVGPIAGATTGNFGLSGSPATTGQPGDICTVTLESTLITDADAIDPPNELDGDNSGDTVDGDADDFVSTYTIDSPPALLSSTPAANALVNTAQTVSFTYDEPVTDLGSAITLNCAGPIAGTITGSGTATLTFTPDNPLPAGASCLATAVALQINDADAFDPPQNPTGDSTITFNVDAAPAFVSALPAAAAVVNTTPTISFTFNENVDNLGTAITLNCGANVTGTTSGDGTPTLTFTPSSPLTAGASCTATAVALQIGDSDAIDPPQNPIVDVTRSFTVDAAPEVLSTIPTDGATSGAAANLTITFSEPVNFNVASFLLECPIGNAFPFAVSGSGSATATINPTGNLPVGTVCTVTVSAAGIADVDAIDLPDGLLSDFVFDFTAVNAPPVVVAANVLSYTENDPPTAASPALTVTDPDGDPLIGATVQITGNSAPAEDTLVFTDQLGIVGNYTPALGLMTLSGSASQADYQTALRTVRYANSSDSPSTLTRTLTWVANDGVDLSLPVTSTITLTLVDDAPVAVADSASVTEDAGATAIPVLANDTDVDGGPISVASVTQPANGTVVITGGGTGLTYVPNPNYCNTPPGTTLDTFTYTLSPGGSVATVTVSVTCVDDDPVAVADSATVNEDSGANAINVLANDTDIDGGPISVTSVTQPANGVVVITGGGTGLTYQPNPNYCNNPPGTTLDTFTYVLAPGGSSTTVTVTVTCVDDPPVAVADSATVNEDSGANAINVLANDTDVDGGPISVTSVTQPANGTVVITGGGTGLTYAPLANYCNNPPGTALDTFSYTLTPGGSSTTVTMTVTCINDPPVAGNDAFDFIGNTELRVDLAAGTTPAALETTVGTVGVLSNDSDPVEGDSLSVTQLTVGACVDNTAPFDCSDPAVGRVQLSATGQFSFVPAPGDISATETFSYQVSDNGVPAPASATGTVTLTRVERVWYVRNNATAGGNGTSATPFDTLLEAENASLVNDYIFVYFGNGSTTGQNAGIVLKTGQHLIGEHNGLSIPVNLNGNGAPTDLIVATPGNRPLLDHTGAGLSAVSAFNAVPTEIVGLNLAGNANGIDITTTAAFAGSAALQIRDNVVGSAGAEGIDINAAGTGTLTLLVHDNTVTATGNGIDITNTGTGSSRLSRFDDNVIGGNSAAGGIELSNLIIDATPNLVIDAVSGGTTVVGQPGNGVGGSGFRMINVVGELTFTDLDIYNDAGPGLFVTSTGSLNAALGTGFRISVPAGVSTIDSNGGPAVSVNNASVNLPLQFMESTNSATTGLSLVNAFGGVGQTALAVANGSISAATSAAVNINSGNGNITLGIPVTNAASSAVLVTARTSDTVAFNGAITDTGNGILLTNNTGATINFSGGVAVSSGAAGAFSATGGGTVSVTGSANTLATTTATAVNVVNTTIGAAGMTWRSVASTTASANTAIVLNNTGAGAFSVTGTGAAGTGGTISNKSVDAVQLSSTGGLVTLDRMIIEDIGTMTGAIDTRSGHDAIQGLNVNAGLNMTGTTIRRISDQAIHGGTQDAVLDIPTVWNGLTLSGVTIENTNRYHVAGSGDANNEGTVRILGIRGTVNVTNSTFSLGAQPLDLEVTSGTLNLTATNNFFDRSYKEFTSGVRASIGNHCVDVRVLAGATANITIGDRVNAALGNNFLNCRIGSVRVVNQPGAGANTDVIIARNNFRVNDHSSGIGGDFDFPMGGTLVWNLSSGTIDTIVENNLFELVTRASGGNGQLTLIAEGGPLRALVQNNTFDRPGDGPWWVQSRNSAASVLTARFVNNTVIRGAFPCTIDPACGGGYFAPGLRALADANTGATLNFTMENNVMARHDTGFDPGQTVEVRALNSGAAPTVCASFTSNQSPDGYSLEQLLGTVRTVAAAGSCLAGTPSPTCQAVLQANGNQGGAGVGTTLPPFVNVLGTVTVNATPCPIPTGAPF